MKNTMKFAALFFVAGALLSCVTNFEADLCDYNGYNVQSVSQEETDCECGHVYYIHLRNEHVFKDVRVNKSAYLYYQDMLNQAKVDSSVARIVCKDFVELKEDSN